MIVATFGGQPDRSYSRLTAQAAAMLAAERDERGKTPVLVIDEAHLLRYEQLETIRMLTNHNLDADSPLACLLIGQPTLRRTMKLAVLADRKSTRLNSSHTVISYAVFCLKKKKKQKNQ